MKTLLKTLALALFFLFWGCRTVNKQYVKSIKISPLLQINWYIDDLSSAFSDGFESYVELFNVLNNNTTELFENDSLSDFFFQNDTLFFQFCDPPSILAEEGMSLKKQSSVKVLLLKKGIKACFVYDGVSCDMGDERLERLPLEVKRNKPHFFDTGCDERIRHYQKRWQESHPNGVK